MIRVGIVGSNYGRTVVLPAFRADPRCEVVALAGSDASRVAEFARAAGVPRGVGDWRTLVDDPTIDAIAIAVPPDLQPEIALRALDCGKPIFVEKPLAADLADDEVDARPLVEKVLKLQNAGYSIGIWGVLHPTQEKEILGGQVYAKGKGIDFRTKEFLGVHDGKMHGTMKYEGACDQQFAKQASAGPRS